MYFISRLEIMSLKRKCDFDCVQSSSDDNDLITTKYIKTDEVFNDNSPSPDERT
jgi:hypothetical protein